MCVQVLKNCGGGIVGTCELSDMGGSAGIHTLILMIEQQGSSSCCGTSSAACTHIIEMGRYPACA